MLGSGSLVCVIRRMLAPEIIISGAASVSMRRPTAICSRLSGSIGGADCWADGVYHRCPECPQPIFGSGQPGTNNHLFSEPARQLSAGSTAAHWCSSDGQRVGCQARRPNPKRRIVLSEDKVVARLLGKV